MELAHFRQLDWDFPDQNSQIFLHNLCWYPSRFIPMIPAQLITSLSKPGDTILDPFCGAGTSLIEALRRKRNAIGVDINPLSCFISSVKARVYSGEYLSIDELEKFDRIISHKENINKCATLFPPRTFVAEYNGINIPNELQIAPWYNERTLRELKALYGYIDNINDSCTKDILKLIFISILMSSSGHESGRPYTYYADNVKPKEPKQKNAIKQYHQKLSRFIREYKTIKPASSDDLKWSVIVGNAKKLSDIHIEPVDLIVTSPPYLNVTDYNMAFRLAHLWFEWSCSLDELKKDEIGSRSLRKRKDSEALYLKDMEICFIEMVNCLKKGKHLCIVIGESKKNIENINNYLISFLIDTIGLHLVHSTSREISQKFFQHPSGGVSTEDILIFRS